MTTNFRRTADWLAACGKEPGNPDHISAQIACDLEEVAEWLMCLDSTDYAVRVKIIRAHEALESVVELAREHASAHKLYIDRDDHAAALDALCDRQVTADGVAYLMGWRKETADRRVMDANDAKLVNGKPVIDASGKIRKPDGWMPARMDDLV